MKKTKQELHENSGKYLEKVEDIITEESEKTTHFTSEDDVERKLKILKSLMGILPSDVDLDALKEEGLTRHIN